MPLLLLLACTGAETPDSGQVPTHPTDSAPTDTAPTDSVPPTDATPPTDSTPPTDTATDTLLSNPTLDLVLLPDTRIYVESDATAAHFEAQTTWVVAQREALGLDCVSQLGQSLHHSCRHRAQAARANLSRLAEVTEAPRATAWTPSVPSGHQPQRSRARPEPASGCGRSQAHWDEHAARGRKGSEQSLRRPGSGPR